MNGARCDGCYRNDLNGRWWCDNCDQWPCICTPEAGVMTTDQGAREARYAEAMHQDWNEIAKAVLSPGADDDAPVSFLRLHAPHTMALADAEVAAAVSEATRRMLAKHRGVVDEITDRAESAEAEVERLREVVAKVEALHWPHKSDVFVSGTEWCDVEGEDWPCPTIRTIRGDADVEPHPDIVRALEARAQATAEGEGS